MKAYKNLRLDHQLCFALYAATHAVTRLYRRWFSELGLTYPQYLVLLALWDDGSLSVGDLARRLDLDAAAVSPLLKRLVAAGLVSRRRDGSDERVVRVYPTSQVDALRGALAEVQSRVDCSTGVAPAEFSQLRETLNRLTQTMAIDREPGRELTG